MENLFNQLRMQFTGAEEQKAGPGGTSDIQKIPIQKAQSFKAEKKQGGKNWFQKQFARKTSHDHESIEMEHAAAVAAAAFAMNLQDVPEQKGEITVAPLSKTKSKVDGTKSPTSLLGSASKRFSSSFKSKDDQSSKVTKSSLTDEKKQEEAITPTPSIKKTSTFTGKEESETQAPIRETSTKPDPVKEPTPPADTERQTKADEWERTELQNIRERYDKLREKIDSWESKKKKKARRKLNREERELLKRRMKSLENFHYKNKCIHEIAEGARTKAEESRRNEQIKANEKADLIRTTGKLPRICFCF